MEQRVFVNGIGYAWIVKKDTKGALLRFTDGRESYRPRGYYAISPEKRRLT